MPAKCQRTVVQRLQDATYKLAYVHQDSHGGTVSPGTVGYKANVECRNAEFIDTSGACTSNSMYRRASFVEAMHIVPGK